MSSPSVLTAGEVVVDVYRDSAQQPLFESYLSPQIGGAAINTGAALHSFGEPPLVWTRVGNGPFGHAIRRTLADRSIPTRLVTVDETYPTALAFVLGGDETSQFLFYHEKTATKRLRLSESVRDLLNTVDWVFLNGFLLAFPPARTALSEFVTAATETDCSVLFDVNARSSVWNDRAEFQSVLQTILPKVDLVKLSLEDAAMTTFAQSSASALASDILENGPDTVFVTKGSEGAYARATDVPTWGPAECNNCGYAVSTVDPTGAGDAFCAGVTESLHHRGENLAAAVALGCAIGAAMTTVKGAFPPVDIAEKAFAVKSQ